MKDMLLKRRLKRDRQIRNDLKFRGHWWEVPLLVLVVIVIWLIGADAEFNLIVSGTIAFSWLLAQIERLHRRVDILLETLNDEVEKQLASKLEGESQNIRSIGCD